MKTTFHKYYDLGWAIENDRWVFVLMPEEVRELVKQMKEAGF